MRWKTTLLLLVLAVGVGMYISLYDLRHPLRKEREWRSKQILDASADSVTQLALDLPQAKVTLIRTEAGWRIAPKTLRADPDLVNRILGELAPLTAERILSASAERPLDLKAFGLAPAVGWMSFVANGRPTTLLLGETTPVHSNRYLKVSDRPEIFVVPSRLFDTANQPSEQFRDHRLIRLDTWMADHVTVSAGATSFTLTRSEDDWRLSFLHSGSGQAPPPNHLAEEITDLADRAQVNLLLDRLTKLAIARFVDDAPQVEQLSTWGFDRPKVELGLSQQRETPTSLTLFFGSPLAEDQALLYAKRSDEPSLYAVAAADVDALAGLPAPPDGGAQRQAGDPHRFRAMACFEFFTSQLSKVEVTQEGTSWSIERAGEAWRLSGGNTSGAATPLEVARVEEFLNQLADLRLSSFVDEAPSALGRYGLDSPMGTIRLWTAGHDEPQTLLVGSAIEGSTNRYGRIAGRNPIVRLPALITELLSTSPDQFQEQSTVHRPQPTPPDNSKDSSRWTVDR